jgi:catechol-2,3-dioxygenase
MLGTIEYLALETKYLDRSQAFYEAFLDLDVRRERDDEVAFATGDAELLLRAPGTTPRGGVHTHYAMSIPADEYDDWYDRLDERFDLVEHSFGDSRSLYFYDPDGNCVELGESPVDGPGVDGIFEVVLEVTDLDLAESFYEAVGFETVDRGDDRTRVRMSTGSFAIELWESQLGIADARGGLHVDFGVSAEHPSGVADRVRDDARSVEQLDDGVRLVDRDGHSLTLRSS